jgi:hypothetical protein
MRLPADSIIIVLHPAMAAASKIGKITENDYCPALKKLNLTSLQIISLVFRNLKVEKDSLLKKPLMDVYLLNANTLH